PALAQADVGIAIGTGTDVAMAAAGVTLVGGDLHGVGRAIALSRGTLRAILQNLFWAFFYNVVLIPVAAAGLLVPVIAAGAMAFSSIFVVTNSLRLRGFKVQAVEPPQSRARQVLEMAPHLVAPMAALAVLIALSMGWITLPGSAAAGEHGAAALYTARLVDVPAELPVGQPVTFTLAIADPAGDTNKQLLLMDDKPIHLAIVSRDLSFFKHEYPERRADGTFPVELTFPAAGDYMLFGDYMPLDGVMGSLAVPLRAGPAGAASAAARLTPDTVFRQAAGDLTVTLLTPGPFPAGQYQTLRFEVADTASGALALDLEPYLGGLGHLAIVDEAGSRFLRVHGSKKSTDFNTLFPAPGFYKLWAEFQRGGQVRLVSFVVEVR
ncbi:MAG: hypothetical protein KA764_18735, partial [Anaerolineales bacterium]|nr:hypothetical protein [Anaerolineales bacterium]